MAHPKRPKSQNKGSKRQAAAKQAAQKKLKDHRATKFRNEDLRTMLDMETPTIYSINESAGVESIKPSMPPGYEPVQDIAKILGDL